MKAFQIALLEKLNSNFGLKAFRVLGWRLTFKMWFALLIKFPDILRKRNFSPVDKYMSNENEIQVHHRYGTFNIYPARIDSEVVEESYCFGSIRELYIRDCYFRFHHFLPEEINTVVDLGANRGLFSAMCTPFATRIIAVEAQTKYNQVIRDVIERQNNFNNIELGNYFVGKNEFILKSDKKVTFTYILDKYKLQDIDFLKIDIEGSEFDIINELPFSRIKYLSMEVHREFGSPDKIINILKENNFEIVSADSQFRITDDPLFIDYIYGTNLSKTKSF